MAKYYIVSEEQLHALEGLAEEHGYFAAGRAEIKEVGLYCKAREDARSVVVPDSVDLIVGYSTPNQSQAAMWHIEEGTISRGITEQDSYDACIRVLEGDDNGTLIPK